MLFRAGGLGDLLVALPSIALVRRRRAGHRLLLAGRRANAELLVRAGVVDAASDFDDPRLAPFFAGGARDGPETGSAAAQGRTRESAAQGAGSLPSGPAFPGGFSLAVGWLNRHSGWPWDRSWIGESPGRGFFVAYDPGSGRTLSRFFFERTWAYLGETAAKRGRGRGPSPAAGSEAEEAFDSCSFLPVGEAWKEEAMAAAGARGEDSGGRSRRLVIHPGSGGVAKRWPLGNFMEVAARASAAGLEGFFVTGEAEEALEAAPDWDRLPAGWRWVRRPSPEVLAGLVAASGLYLGNDSGPTHLAAACGARVIALFRESALAAWRPFGRTTVIAASDDIGEIGPEEVFEALIRADRSRERDIHGPRSSKR